MGLSKLASTENGMILMARPKFNKLHILGPVNQRNLHYINAPPTTKEEKKDITHKAIKMANTTSLCALVLTLLLVSAVERGEAQGCTEWECKRLPNFKCWMGGVGKKLCNDFCKNEGAALGVCVSDAATASHRCLCRSAGCS
ncbi:hypothetical protein EUTSA_v10006301mg [Eutrema salsugineum]|uniref:Knottin scorpion toxin-like domain-containing protein n=1 Tax=Eutrema salsugineum TaxID=72664 RepID=V4NCM6_EUTSA|nr:hypothetical protein EUTSA_v10006301mg [Eutrema salsugineum]